MLFRSGGNMVKIIAVTASAFKEQRAELLSVGMDDFVRKPYRMGEIYACLAKHLGLRFIYEEADEALPEVSLTPDMLAALPSQLRKNLRDALESLDSERITLILAQVAEHDVGLQKILVRLVENFDYPAILKALGAEHDAG